MDNFNFGTFAQQLNEVREEGLSFEDKQLTWDTAEDVKDIVEALENTKVVHYLKLGGNTLGVDAAAAIGKALESHPEYCKALWYNMFSRRLKTETPLSLKHLGNGLIVAKAQLTVLDLSDNALGPNGMVGLEDLLRSPVCYSLQELHLNNCGLGIGGGQMLSKALIDCHRRSTEAGTPLKLKTFIAGRNRLENEGARAIGLLFETLKTLEVIAMPQNSIYHQGIAMLAMGFRQNPNLRILNLNDNTVTQKGAVSLAAAFAFTPHLVDINFGDCLLKTTGSYHFAEALEDNHLELEVVDLSFNEIGANGGLVLVSALQNKTKLKRINIDGNQFGGEGCERIKEAMLDCINNEALDSLEEDQSGYESNSDEDNFQDDEDNDDDDDYIQDTTEEADEDGEYQDEEGEYQDTDDAEETAYTTTQAFPSNLNPNDTLPTNKSFTFGNTSHTTGNTDTTLSKTNSAESFCLSQKPYDLQMFEALQEDNKLQAFKAIIDKFNNDNRLLVLIFTTLKCAHLAQTSSAALDLAMSLYRECIDYAVKTNQEHRVLVYILKQLGLLRSEVKFTSSYDLKSCRFALRETLNKQQIASEHMKNAFTVFLDNLDI